MYRIEAEWVKGGTSAPLQKVELVAGFTPGGYIAQGSWFGSVGDYAAVYPFVLTDDGQCRYAGDQSQARYFSIVKRPVKTGEIFELTWDGPDDRHCYKVTKLIRLNIHPDFPEDRSAPVRSAITADGACSDNLNEPSIFLKTDRINFGSRRDEFKATVAALIDSGCVIAVGEDAIERVFGQGTEFADWLDGAHPA